MLPVNQKCKSLVSWYYRNEYEHYIDSLNVPMVLKGLTELYTRQHLPSQLLSMKTDLKLLNAIKDKIWWSNLNKYKLLYRGSDHNFSAHKFHEITDEPHTEYGTDCPTITLVQDNFGNLFAAFINKTWKIKGNFVKFWRKDNNALLILITSDNKQIQQRTPFVFTPKKGKEWSAVSCFKKAGPCFGTQDVVITDKCNQAREQIMPGISKYSCFSKLTAFENKSFPDLKICGGNSIIWDPNDSTNWVFGFNVNEYEIWQIIE